MRYELIVSIMLTAGSITLTAQQTPFSQFGTTLPKLAYSASAWGDFDNDGDLDLALTGVAGNDPLTAVFRNNGGSFEKVLPEMLPLHYGSVEWGDHDRDGDLDLLVTGIDVTGNPHTRIYINSGGSFSDSGISLPGVTDGQAVWGDFNNDGYPDVLIAGSMMSNVFENDEGIAFTELNAPLPGVETPMCSWNDYNNDGQADVLICGNTGGGIISELFRNDHGTFSKVTITPEPFTGLYGGQTEWADLDNDGDQDLVIAGADLYVDAWFLIYRNDGNDQFTKMDGVPSPMLNPWFDLGDYNSDGLIDIIMMGALPGCGGAAVTRLLQNNGAMDFSDVSILLPGYKLGSVSWGDCNNDGHSDLIFTGLDGYDYPQTDLFLNNLGNTLFSTNTEPSAPQGPEVAMEAERAILRWNSSTDPQTPKNALTYNIRIGLTPDGFEILSPLSLLSNGSRLVAAPGNASADTNWIIAGIEPGNYYFSVQAIDNGFMPGGFSEPFMFSFTPVTGIRTVTENNCEIMPNPFSNRLFIKNKYPTGNDSRIRVINGNGESYYEGAAASQINTSAWPAGIYLLQFSNGTTTRASKLIKH